MPIITSSAKQIPSLDNPTHFANQFLLNLLSQASRTMKKIVLKLDLHDNRIKQKAMKTASGLIGVESVSLDMKDKKMTLSGDVDPVNAVSKLRKLCHTEIVSVEQKKEEKDKKVEAAKVPVPLMHYEAYPLYYQMRPPQYDQGYYATSYEENPSGCVIC